MLKRVWVVGLVIALSSVCLSAQRPRDLLNRRITAQVVGVIDGDTVDLLIAPKKTLRVRLHGIDTPERGEPFYTQARNFTRVLMFSREVEAIGKDVDGYGRLVARISVDGKDASATLLAAGLACTFHRYVSDPALESALARARGARAGFWASGAQQPSCVARELKRIGKPRAKRDPDSRQSLIARGDHSARARQNCSTEKRIESWRGEADERPQAGTCVVRAWA